MSGAKEVRIVDPRTGGAKGRKAERYDLIPSVAMDCVARVFGFGASKYSDYNWLKGYAWSLSIGALERHLSKFKQSKDWDDEEGGSGELHTAAIAWHAIVLTTFQLLGRGTDDRLMTHVRQFNEELLDREYSDYVDHTSTLPPPRPKLDTLESVPSENVESVPVEVGFDVARGDDEF